MRQMRWRIIRKKPDDLSQKVLTDTRYIFCPANINPRAPRPGYVFSFGISRAVYNLAIVKINEFMPKMSEMDYNQL